MDEKINLESILTQFSDPSEAWDSRAARKLIANSTADWLSNLCKWTGFITLTFENETPPDVARNKFRSLVTSLNRNAFGKHYTRKVGHSYFSYLLGIEYQQRDVIHFHVLVDRPVNFDLIHRLWNAWAGFAWTSVINDFKSAVEYVSKYVSKGGEVYPFRAQKSFTPNILPYWWKEPSAEQLNSSDETINS